MTSSRSRSAVVSLAVHSGVIALVLLASNRFVLQPSLRTRSVVVPLIAPHVPKVASPNAMGGGGGAHQAAPATAGRLPKIAPRQFVPPALEIVNAHPKLAMEMSIEAPPEAALMDRQLPNLGDPLSRFLNNSAGAGGPLGIGNGKGTGLGNKRGPGMGEGDSLMGTVYRPGNGVTVPVLLHSVEPEFSDEARRAKYTGTVMLRADIDDKGHPRNLRVVHSLGMGLDEKAAEAVLQWLFRPGTKDGKAVAVSALIEVSFHLL